MKKTTIRKVTALLLAVLICSLLSAESWKTVSSADGAKTLSRADGKTVTLQNAAGVSDDAAATLTQCLDAVWALPGLKGTKASAAFESRNTFRFVIYPDALSADGIDLLPYLPSGLVFRFDTALFYDVPVKVGELLPRVQGTYIAPDAFLSQLASAVRAPEMFLSDAYVFKRLIQLEDAVKTLNDADVYERLDRLEASVLALENIAGELAEADVYGRLSRLETAVMALSKKGIFAKAALVDPEIVTAVTDIYNETPMTQKEMAAELKLRGIAASSADIAAVYMVYLGLIE